MVDLKNIVKDNYDGGACPDCLVVIPDDVSNGDACRNCGHVFYAPIDTEEVCDECGSTNIGYDALVKNIGGELEVVGGPYDSCQCINEYCQNLEPHVRNVPVQDLRDCDGQNCHYHGDKDVMKEVKSNEKESYWYCSRCRVDRGE